MPAASSVLGSALSLVAAFGPPLTIATAALVYFGWARVYVGTRILGLDATVFDLTTQDYVLGSVSTLWLPLLIVAAIGVGWLLLHERAVAAIQAKHLTGLRLLVRGLTYGLVAFPLLGVAASRIWPAWGELVLPLSITVGILATTYGITMRRRISAALGTHNETATLASWHRPLARVLIGLLITLTLFWELTNYAGVVGRGYAQQVVAGLPDRTGVIVYAVKDLQLDAAGIHETRFTEKASTYGYRYEGLRLLQKSGDKYFLLPAEWNFEEGKTIVLTDNDAIRLEFTT
ncbi:hypothetical protein GCM10027569_01330 [Flindersiella endophytica]